MPYRGSRESLCSVRLGEVSVVAHPRGRINRVSVDFSGGGRCIFDILSRRMAAKGTEEKGGGEEEERVTLSTETASGE